MQGRVGTVRNQLTSIVVEAPGQREVFIVLNFFLEFEKAVFGAQLVLYVDARPSAIIYCRPPVNCTSSNEYYLTIGHPLTQDM